MGLINYADEIMRRLPDLAAGVLLGIMDDAGVDEVLITSTVRSPVDQARVMFNNLEAHGVAAQKMLYKLPGQQVIDVYASMRAMGHNATDTQAAMVQKILELGSQNISHHCVDPDVRSVFDVAPSSIPDLKRGSFVTAVSNCDQVDKFLQPPVDPAFHIEIPLGSDPEETVVQSA
jgi:hypothetical protein